MQQEFPKSLEHTRPGRILRFLARLFNKRSMHKSSAAADTFPLSIQPNPSYFVDVPGSPFQRLTDLIELSDGGVYAITGVRGAGKSVLLNSISNHFRDRFHSLSIAAPVGSSHEMDFFVAFFRMLCDSVKKRLQRTILNETLDLTSIGNRQARRQLLVLIPFAVGLSILVTSSILLQISLVDERQVEADFHFEIMSQQAREAKNDQEVLSIQNALKSPSNTAAETAALNEKLMAALAKGEVLGTRIMELQAAENDLEKDPFRFNRALFEDKRALWTYALGAALFICVLLGWFCYRFLLRFQRFRSNPAAMGLLVTSGELIEHLDYELSRSNESEISIPVAKLFSGKFKVSSGLKERSISLPGLSSHYVTYVQQLLQVLPDKLVICIDELDKITDDESVRSILREIKGGLYVKGCFYLISLSEDAVQAFGGRMSSTRDIFESTFDESFRLDRLDVESCKKILMRRLEQKTRGSEVFGSVTREVLLLCSILSGGIPRDLIRNFREAVTAVQRSESESVYPCWRRLYLRKLSELKNKILLC
jgi:hypothetical protein